MGVWVGAALVPASVPLRPCGEVPRGPERERAVYTLTRDYHYGLSCRYCDPSSRAEAFKGNVCAVTNWVQVKDFATK